MPRKALGGSSDVRSSSHLRGSDDALPDARRAPDGRATGPDVRAGDEAGADDDEDDDAGGAAVRCRFEAGASGGDRLTRLVAGVGVLPAAAVAVVCAPACDGADDGAADDDDEEDDDDDDEADDDGVDGGEAGPPGVTDEEVMDAIE